MLGLQGILFDLDGVLVNSIPAHGKAWAWIMSTIGLEVDPFVAPLTEGLHSQKIARLIFEAADYKPGLLMSTDELETLIDKKRDYYRKIVGQVSLSKEVMKVLRSLKNKGFALALVTSTSKQNLDHIVSTDQQSVFDTILWASSVTHSKPHPEPYLLAAKQLNLAPDHCLVVENAVFGIRSARAAGAWCVAVASTLPVKYLQEAHLVIPSVLELGREEFWTKLEDIMNRVGEPGILPPSEELISDIPVRFKYRVSEAPPRESSSSSL